MKCSKHSTFSQEQEGGYSQTLFLGMSQFVPSNGTPIVAKSSGNEPPKDGSPACKCGKETLNCSQHPSGKDEWIASMRASLASHTALLENARDTLTIETCGRKSSESFGKFNQNGSFSKMSQASFPIDSLEPSSVIWPSSGMMRGGHCWELTRLVPRTKENVGGCWPTPRASDCEGGVTKCQNDGGGFYRVNKKGVRYGVKLRDAIGGKPNPVFDEWLMGFPIRYTELRRVETAKCLSMRPLRGKS